jgi:polysaccharide biosynthesis protein PslG
VSSKFSPFRRRTPLLAILVAAASFWLPAHALAAGPARDDFYGVNPGDLFKLPQSQWDTHLSAIAADGVQVVRMGAWWSDLEPGPPVSGEHNYSFSDIDKQVVALARHGLQWEPLLCFSATWGSKIDGDYNAAPDGNDNFARFGAALARRYGRNGSFWAEHPELPALPVSAYEVWNEENASVYWHPGTPSSYADLYAATRSAIHQVDDASRVVVGGLAAADTGSVQAPADFLRAMYAHRPDLRGTVDAVALHPYGREPQAVYAKVAQFRHDLDAIAGPGVPLELTEIGWTTADTSEQHRADYLGEVASTLARTDCGIDRLTAYAWVGPEQAAGDREQWFGIANRDGSNKPSASAYAASVKTMRGLAGNAPDGTVKLCSGTAGSVPRSVSGQGRTAKAAKLQLKVSVRRHPRRAGRLLVRVRCSTGCLLRVELRAAKLRGKAARASRRRATRVASRRTRRSARSRTLNIRYAKRMGRGSGRIRIKVVATTRGGSRATRYRTVRVHRTHARARARA